MRLSRLVVAASLLVASLFVFSSVASAKPVSPGTWTARVCSARTDLEQVVSSFNSAQHSTTTRGAKAQLVTFLGAATSASRATVRNLQKAGIPNVPNGKKIADGLVKGTKRATALFAHAEAQARALPTANVAAFKAAVKKVSATLTQGGASLKSFGRSLKKLDTSGKLSSVSSC